MLLTAVVGGGKTAIGFGANVTDRDALDGGVVDGRADGHNENMGSIVFALDDELGLQDGVCADDTQAANPPFRCLCIRHNVRQVKRIGEGVWTYGQVRAVDDKLVCLFIKGGSGLQTGYVGAMAL